jgi:hypothetical protein
MSRVEDAQMRLYEDADLRDELTDDEAEKLFRWAEAELARLDAASADDDAFEAQAETLMKLLKQMNRYAGRQGQLSAQGATEAPDKIAALASELGHSSDAAHVAAAATGDPISTIEALTSLMNTQSDPPPPPDSATNTLANDPPALRGAQIYAWETNADDSDNDPNNVDDPPGYET